jgi:hypothetical protein
LITLGARVLAFRYSKHFSGAAFGDQEDPIWILGSRSPVAPSPGICLGVKLCFRQKFSVSARRDSIYAEPMAGPTERIAGSAGQ